MEAENTLGTQTSHISVTPAHSLPETWAGRDTYATGMSGSDPEHSVSEVGSQTHKPRAKLCPRNTVRCSKVTTITGRPSPVLAHPQTQLAAWLMGKEMESSLLSLLPHLGQEEAGGQEE